MNKEHGFGRFSLISHFHPMPEGILCKEWPSVIKDPKAGTFPELIRVMNEIGVEKAVAFAPFAHQAPEAEAHEWLWRNIIVWQGRVAGFVSLNPQGERACQKLRKYMKKGFAGAKIHPSVMKIVVNDKKNDPYYKTAQELGIPIVFHTGVHGWHLKNYRPLLIDDVAQRFPDLKIIMAHIGGTAFFSEALGVLQNNKNVYGELTSTRKIRCGFSWYLSDEFIRILLASVGPDRLIYGTDWPWNNSEDIRLDIERIRSWNITDEEKGKILGGNLQALIVSRQE